MTPLERAARVLYRTDDFDPHRFGEDAVWPDLVDYVRLILKAIREPSEAMIERGISDGLHNQPSGDNPDTDRMATDTWQAMIDAALAED